MQNVELSSGPCGIIPPKRRRKRGRAPINPTAFEGLFLVLVKLRAANARSLFELWFRERGTPVRTAMRRLHDLVDAGFLAHLRLDGARCVYHLTPKALGVSPEIERWARPSLATPPPDRQAMFCWLRSSLWAALTADGWKVGNDGQALYALRRSLIDTLEAGLAGTRDGVERQRMAWNLKGTRECEGLVVRESDLLGARRWRCNACGAARPPGDHHDPVTRERCAGAFRPVPVTPLDIAWEKRGEKYDAMVLFVDNPSVPLDGQLDDVSAVCLGEPLLPIITRAVDPRSAFDRATMKWVEIGRRHAELRKAFARLGRMHARVREIDYRPDLQAYVVR
ncbi:MAG: hypothetical protein IT383_10500 [Deltaproteobacteria bacterium]|nr:hypothetical protein [Deltaproteobacteria bacterium]